MLNLFKNRRRKRILDSPWSSAWDAVLQTNVGQYDRLSSDEQDKLRKITQIMVAEKHWEAHDGLEISDEIKVTIAGTAALMLLGVEGFYFEPVKTIIVFPRPIRRKVQDGPIVGREMQRSGEAWQSGQVILSWQDVHYDAHHPDDGRNLVIHEFAHCLDGLDGEMGGNLNFDDPADAQRWQRVSAEECKALGAAAKRRQPTLLSYYGATNLAEFFAVSSETFFEQPVQFEHWHPELFDLLVAYYHLDPREWV